MAVQNQEELIKVLASGDYDAVLGTPESQWFDIKMSPYSVENGNPLALSRKGRYELCKDVAALANQEGGVLLLGVAEATSPVTGQSVADKLTPITVAAIDLAHYKTTIMGNIYPIIDVKMTWYPAEKGKGYLAIVVAKRREGNHIVKHVVDENGENVSGITIPIRIDDQTWIMPSEALYELIKERKAQTGPQSLGGNSKHITDETIKIINNQTAQRRTAAKLIRDQLITSQDWDDLPVMILQSIPISGPKRLNGFYDELESAFRDTKPLRSMGFNLNSFGRETSTEEGAYLKSGIRDAVLQLNPDGTLTMAIRGNASLLGWGVNKDDIGRKIRINSIVLIEEVFEFVRYISQTLKNFGLSNWEYQIDIRRFKQYNVCLNAYGPNSLNSFELKQATKDTWEDTINSSGDYSKDAFKILTEIYALFALSEKMIPYISDGQVTDQNIVDLSKNVNGY